MSSLLFSLCPHPRPRTTLSCSPSLLPNFPLCPLECHYLCADLFISPTTESSTRPHSCEPSFPSYFPPLSRLARRVGGVVLSPSPLFRSSFCFERVTLSTYFFWELVTPDPLCLQSSYRKKSPDLHVSEKARFVTGEILPLRCVLPLFFFLLPRDTPFNIPKLPFAPSRAAPQAISGPFFPFLFYLQFFPLRHFLKKVLRLPKTGSPSPPIFLLARLKARKISPVRRSEE